MVAALNRQLAHALWVWIAPAIVLGALALGLAPASAAARHVECGDRITRDVRLDADLVNCPRNGLTVAADGITIDLGGHVVDGSGRGIGISNGFWGDGHRDVTIRNGKVRAIGSSTTLPSDIVDAQWVAERRAPCACGSQELIDWLAREMTAPHGGFYATLDADSEGEEGKFYVWTREEAAALLTPQEYAAVGAHYGLDRPPNFEKRCWHLRIVQPPKDEAALEEQPWPIRIALLAHELAHIRRWDLWVNVFQRVVETLLFYHPAVWWLSDRLRSERELCSDELAVRAVGRRVVYAEALEFVARKRWLEREPLLAAGIGGGKMALLNRIRHVLGTAQQKRQMGWWSAFGKPTRPCLRASKCTTRKTAR